MNNNILKNTCVSIVFGLSLVWLSSLVNSNFLSNFLEANLIMLLIALLAINITTMSVVMVKLKEISDAHGGAKFPKAVKEMKIAVYEQIILIVLGLISQILCKSELISKVSIRKDIQFIISAVPAIVLVYAITILWDTGRSIFVILSQEENS